MTNQGLDRRSVLGAACAVAGAFALARAQGEDPARTPRTIRRSLKYGMVGEGATLYDKFALLKDLGYDGVELDSPNNLDADEVLRAKERTGLLVPGVVNAWHWQHSFGDPDPAVRQKGREGLERSLRDAALYGASTVLLVPGVVNGRMAYGDVHTRSRAEIGALVPLAEELGVTIAFENVWNHFLLSPLEAAQYVDSFESKAVGWYLDLGNLVRNAWPAHWVQALGQRIVKLDIKDYSRKLRDDAGLWRGFEAEIGDGDVGWAETMAALDRVGYTTRPEAWASAEVGGGDRKRLADVLARMDRVLSA